MQELVERYKNIVIQIATPYSTGTGFYIKAYNLIVTNNHVVEGNRDVTVEGVGMPRQMIPYNAHLTIHILLNINKLDPAWYQE